ncbi:MAG TPA: glycoside hydrolase family 2 TIM barrel-domain containing protein [Clostridiaceae bacterium]
MKKALEWTVGFTKEKDMPVENRVVATVPGAVQLDWAKAKGYGSYTYGDNYKDYGWMEDVYWSYITKLEFPDLEEKERVYFVCKGIDYKFIIKLNNKIIHKQEGMFTPVEIDLTTIIRGGEELEVLIFPAPKKVKAESSRAEADQSCKPACSYGWDWHPRLIPLGIWDETYMEIRKEFHIKDAEVTYELNSDFTIANVNIDINLNQVGKCFVRCNLFDKQDNLVMENITEVTSRAMKISYDLQSPELWWPNGQGEATLYRLKIELLNNTRVVIDKKESRIGFRKIKLVMHEGAWDYPNEFPKSRSNPPITLQVNGIAIFCKGSNWVNPEIFPGVITKDTYYPLINLAKEGNMNMFRSWGGGIINKDSFFEICDELGIMVWQEFPLACNEYEGTPHYLKVLDEESKAIIKRLKPHPSVVLWCGGNELFNSWSRMTDQSLALRLLNKNCYDLDPNRPFLMTSPLMGMAHGNYVFRSEAGEDVFQAMAKASNTAYTEFGCPSPASLEILQSIIPKEELFPPRPGTTWETHHGFNTFLEDTWLMPDLIKYYFGESNSLEELIQRGQILQSEGYKCIFEEARRQKPKCSMALNWCYNEPWPTAANNSIISWRAKPKPAYYAVKASCRPVLCSARISKFCWKPGELFNPEIYILNDSPLKVKGGQMDIFLYFGEEEIKILKWEFPDIEPNKNFTGPIVRYNLPDRSDMEMKLVLRISEQPGLGSEYYLVYRPTSKDRAIINHNILNL